MGGFLWSLLIYILGGFTFPFLLLALVLLHAHLTFPTHNDTASRENEQESIVQPGDDADSISRAQKSLDEKFQRRDSHEDGVWAGYFTVCREFTPQGVNGRPPERTTPVGSTTVTAPSPSVYQTMYRSIFDRKQSNSPLDNKGVGKQQRRGTNVFYVVLRHGHLMLFDDDEQLEVRHVVSLAHHTVSIYSGGDETPEGELFIKRNAICLSRRTDTGDIAADGVASKPFYLFSDNCSDKEDFYFALLRNQENHPIPQNYELKDIITLVQKLHSSEEQLQTRWINAFIGRIFLAIYKTPEVENFVRSKITKKISRVKTPSFLSKISLRKIDMGEAAPVITNPRLKDLTVDGELVVEADVRYAGNFRIEVAATARIDLGTRFKAREVNLLLAVVVKRVEGHAMVRIKPPPSNRLWLTFQTMPKIDMTIEPIVSSRQITYTLILRHIENRIKEVIAESLVFPNWDDSPFYQSDSKTWRGGIWADPKTTTTPDNPEEAAAQNGDVDAVEHLETESEEPVMALPQMEKSISQPLSVSSPGNTFSRKAAKSAMNLLQSKSSGSSTSIDIRNSVPDKPRAMRSGSFASASPPTVGIHNTTADAIRSTTPPDHSHAIAAISALSQSSDPFQSPVGSPLLPTREEKSGSQSSVSSKESVISEKEVQDDSTPQPLSDASNPIVSSTSSSYPPSLASLGNASFKSEAPSMKPPSRDPRREDSASSSGKSSTTETKRISLAAMTNAAVKAKTWGWSALQRHGETKTDGATDGTSPRPLVMGRGQPLPPPGQPLPLPDKKTKTAPIPVPKRKPLPPPDLPPDLPQRPQDAKEDSAQQHNLPPPVLPKRRRNTRNSAQSTSGTDDLFVVEAPVTDSDNEHTTPSYMPPWVDDVEGTDESLISPATVEHELEPPRLPARRPLHRVLSGSPEEDGPKLPSWVVAQEEEARSRSNIVDEDNAVV